jgi:protein-export membrane protein SecD
MIKGFKTRLVIILFVTLFSLMLVLPTFSIKVLSLQIEAGKMVQAQNELQVRYKDDGYSFEVKDGKLLVRGFALTDAVMNEIKLNDYIINAEFLPHWSEKYLLANKLKLGLDLQGGMNLVIQADYERMEEKTGRTLTDDDKERITSQAIEKISSRVNLFGVSEPVIRPKGNEAIELQLPGVSDPQAVKDAVGKTGQVEYHLVDDEWTEKVLTYFSANSIEIPTDRINLIVKLRELSTDVAEKVSLPENLEIYYNYDRDPDTDLLYPTSPIVLQKVVSMSGDDIENANPGVDDFQKPAVLFTLTAKGGEKFARVTGDNIGKRLAIMIDEQVRSAPVINGKIAGGSAQITGNFTYGEVEVLANVIEEGALPVSLIFVEERTVGPSLGQDSINAGFKAIIIGLAGIMIFMLFYYKLSGIVANLCLILNMVFILAVFSWLKATLTLPGIAGLILTVGMSVDANVIIYERIKEELKNGKSPRIAVSNGFGRAFWTIFDANLTTLIAAFILSQVGTGPIKGFAVTLVIGILSSMFSALYVSRFIFEIITSNRNLKKISI